MTATPMQPAPVSSGHTRETAARQALVHLTAGAIGLLYAWLISRTAYVTTSVQFVSPLAVVLLSHLAWLAASRRLGPGFATIAFGRTFVTALGVTACTALAALYAPMPADAAATAKDAQIGEIIGGILGIIACLTVLALVVAAAAGVIYVVALSVRAVYRWLRRRLGRPPGSGGNRLNDAGAIALAFAVIGAASLEGLGPALSFATRDGAASSLRVAAPPARVWREVGRATSPAFPLPVMLKSIPQPVAVLVDTGADLGSRRVVRFRGREGEGDLTLEVVRRTNEEAVFAATSDTSPIAMWVRQRALTFRVEPEGTGSRVTVTSDYDRLLAPAWFFRPYVRLAAYLAVDVLARDTKARAEHVAH